MRKILLIQLFIVSTFSAVAQTYNNPRYFNNNTVESETPKPEPKEEKQVTTYYRGSYTPINVMAPELPKSFTLFGERMPLEIWDVRERFDRELLVNTYMQGSTSYIIKHMGRWMQMIEDRLKANGVPDDFKYLCVAESALQNQISKAGAVGFWQFMSGTAPLFGLYIDHEVDERYDPVKATDAACKYLKQAYNKFGNWTAAAASYNCGMGGYNGAMTTQGETSFYKILLPEETMRYIFRIAALKYILDNQDKFGFRLTNDVVYHPLNLRKETISYGIGNLVAYAKSKGTDYKSIRMLNPWIRSNSLNNSKGRTYTILLPQN
jgi:membrane-bound lytic murein transglycosylase D